MVYIDEVEVDQEGIAEIMLDESAIAQVAREYLRKKLPSFLFINDINSTMPTFLGCSMIELIKLLFIVFYIAGLFFFFAGPGTSLRLPGTSHGGGPTPAIRFINTDVLIWNEFYL